MTARLLLPLALLACSKPDARPPVASPERAEDSAIAAPPAVAPPSSALPAATTAKPAPSVHACAPEAGTSSPFTKIFDGPVLSAAFGTPPRAAVWSGRVATLFEGAKSRELPAPRLPEHAEVEIFFGRDNQPRLMGFAPGEPGKETPVYLRFREGAFRREPSELGPLGSGPGALYGVLGFDDPEVVCRPRDLCLVKRVTGWGRVPAHEAPARVVLRGGGVFALHADRVERLGERGFEALEPARAFQEPLDAWLAPSGALWIVDRSEEGLFRLEQGRWTAVASPIREPRAVFGTSEAAVFVAGKNGAAVFDGSGFRCVDGVPGPLHLALAAGDTLWLAGESGVFASRR